MADGTKANRPVEHALPSEDHDPNDYSVMPRPEYITSEFSVLLPEGHDPNDFSVIPRLGHDPGKFSVMPPEDHDPNDYSVMPRPGYTRIRDEQRRSEPGQY